MNFTKLLAIFGTLIITLFGGMVTTAAPLPTNHFGLRLSGTWITPDCNPINSTSEYYTSGMTCTTSPRVGGLWELNPNDRSWWAVEKSQNKTYWRMRKSPVTGKYNGVMYLKCMVLSRAGVWPAQDGWMEFCIVLSETSRNNTTGDITFSGTWQTLSGTGPCALWSGNGTISSAKATFVKSPNDLNPTTVTFEGDVSAYPGTTSCLELTGQMNKNEAPQLIYEEEEEVYEEY